jgi:hypothetical protein
MVTMTTATVTREHVWAAFRGTHDLRKREWYHSILLLFDGKSYDMAQWLYGNSEEHLHDPRRREV